jgi:GNAT superfamily N-acetyltransferase
MTIAFRPMQPADRQFVISGWSSSYRASKFAGLIRNSSWATVMHREIDAYLDMPDTQTFVACEPGEFDHLEREFLYGFIATRRTGAPYVYYCYVKRLYRGRGIARGLFDAAGVDPAGEFAYACETGASIELRRAGKISASTFDSVPAKEAA